MLACEQACVVCVRACVPACVRVQAVDLGLSDLLSTNRHLDAHKSKLLAEAHLAPALLVALPSCCGCVLGIRLIVVAVLLHPALAALQASELLSIFLCCCSLCGLPGSCLRKSTTVRVLQFQPCRATRSDKRMRSFSATACIASRNSVQGASARHASRLFGSLCSNFHAS